MPVEARLKEEIKLPRDVSAHLANGVLTVKGPKGELKRSFTSSKISIEKNDGAIVLSCELPKRKDKALFGTFVAHINNMIRGVTEGFEYNMKVVYSHFPIKSKVVGKEFIIENFLGERVPRKAPIVGSTNVQVNGEEIALSGINLEEISQTAANIERATKIRNYDPRVFQDGIYIVEKAGKKMSLR